MSEEEKQHLKKKFKQITELTAYIIGNLTEENYPLSTTANSIISICKEESDKLN